MDIKLLKKIRFIILLLLLAALFVWGIEKKLVFPKVDKAENNIQTSQENIISEEDKLNELGLEKVYVSYVIDGDTFVLSDDRKVRLVGVNCPEDTSTKEVLGDIATRYTTDMILNKYVYLEKDTSETDKYGRLLRNVWIEIPNDFSNNELINKSLNTLLVKKGLAKPMTILPDSKYSISFNNIAKESKDSKQGMWAFDKINGTTSGDEIN